MRCIAIPFEMKEGWMGGSYYIRNLVSAMKLLSEAEQPFILLVSEQQESVRFIQDSGYPHIGWVRPQEFDELAETGNTDVVFPHPIAKQEARTISWIPDFQELHLGYFFSNQEIASRRKHHRQRFATVGLIVSSEDVRKDVDLFYPGECKNIAVVRFASFDLPDPTRVNEVRLKYKLTESYVICANQVWLHKNHILVIRAIALLKERGISSTVVFTGNETDYRVSGYTEFLKSQAVQWGIADRVHFLGFIPRGDQLCLMKGARYVLQPSLFEGWSTVIEDAKAMGKFIVASDLKVHKEQLTEACRFFFRHDPMALADVMEELEQVEKFTERTIDYAEARIRFARDFMGAVHKFLPVDSAYDNEKALAKIRTLSSANFARKTQDKSYVLPTTQNDKAAESGKKPYIQHFPKIIPTNRLFPINKVVARIKLGLPLNRKLLLFGADNIENKRLGGDLLQKAIVELVSKGRLERVDVIMFGYGSLKIPLKIHNMGQIADENRLSLIYSAADALIFPSGEDNAPLSVAESLLCGTPVIAIPRGNVPEILKHKATCYIDDYLDVNGMCECIESVLKDNWKDSLRKSVQSRTSALSWGDR